jgi:pSer/pThr/pTyr-binding forkhead associated (FHA) protein
VSTLIVKDGPMAGRRVTVESEMTIGRENADLTIDDPEISRYHAVIRPSGDGVQIEDRGSTNGTWVNDNRIQGSTRLSPGDIVKIGNTTLEVERESRSGETVAAPLRRPGATVIAPSGGTPAAEPPVPVTPPPVAAPPPSRPQVPAAQGPPPQAPSQPQWAPSQPQAQYSPPTQQGPPPPIPPKRRIGVPGKGPKKSNVKWLMIGGGILAALVIAFLIFKFFLQAPSKDDFIAQADEICEQANKDLNKLGLNSGNDVEKALDQAVKITEGLQADLEDLDRPDEDAETLDKFFVTLDDFNEELKGTVQQIKKGDVQNIDDQRLTQLGKKVDGLAKDFGFKECRGTADV